MRRSNLLETVAGIFVLIFTIFLFTFVCNKLYRIEKSHENCYSIYGLFSDANGIDPGDSIKISGVKIGRVTGVTLDKDTYVARIDMCINRDIKLSIDSAATITSNGVMGNKFITITPGADTKLLADGGRLQHTQSEANIGGIIDKIFGLFSRS
ncbi:outer membrane lipid asymmetry maintenance protein MlaD [Wolbachia pipientis]|uniref:Outer membrane lipid asymmetry maintenance protein MlaD n=1 Tax=Wolbachia pipientis TaxID=955 RepID=A0A1E7QL00_WOLPI|nr:outer membrane lipid asymmetry maintenance protein MlaD [Wolbachia pipientis]OEY87123.1 outer membrane lipid asymmetry maintenance protein MlaD [Wolbachia pipientis]